MSASVVLRHLEEGDLERITLVRNGSRTELPEHRAESPEEVAADVFTPDFDPAGCWLAVQNGDAVGYAIGLVESGRLKVGRREARIDLEILPGHRGQGFDRELVRRVLDYARARGMSSVLTWSEGQERWRRNLLEISGFEDVHRWYRLVLQGHERPGRRGLPEGFELESEMIRHVLDGDIDRFVSVRNEAFAEGFDFFPVTSEDWIRQRDTTLETDRIAWVEKDREIIGFCVSQESSAYNRQHGTRMGYILSLCVRKTYRRRGIGTALLADGIEWTLGRGMDRTYLAVDADNENALRLYRSIGFSILREGSYHRITL